MLDPIWIGVIINLGGNVVINISHNAVKYANFKRRIHAEQHTSLNSSVLSNADQLDGVPNAPMPADMAGGCCSSRARQVRDWLQSKTRWDWLGLIFFIIGNIANFVSLGFAPQSMLAACGSVQFATNVFCELYFKGTAITGRVLKATCVILAGNTLIVAFASHESQQLNVDELFRLYFEPAYDVYCVILFAAIVALYVFYEETKKRVREYQRAYDRGMLARIEAGDPSVYIAGVHGLQGPGAFYNPYHHHHGVSGGSMSLSPHSSMHMGIHANGGLPEGPSQLSGGGSMGSSSSSGGGLGASSLASVSGGHGAASSSDGGHDAMGMGLGMHSTHAGGGGGGGSGFVHTAGSTTSSGGGLHGSSSGANGHARLVHAHSHPPLPPMPTPIPTWRLRMLPFSYASISAIIGTQSVLLAKSISELLRTTADGRQQFSSYFTWVILAAWGSSIMFWMYRMTTALRKFDKEPLIIPVLQVVWTIFSIVGGGIYFQEFNKMPAMHLAFFTLGVLMLLAGVYLLTPPSPPPSMQQQGMGMGMGMGGMVLHQNGAMHPMHHLNDVELASLGLDGSGSGGGGGASGGSLGHSPFGLRHAMVDLPAEGGGGDSALNSVSPPLPMHSSLYSDGTAPIMSGGGGGSSSGMELVVPPPGKATRVSSTGRIIIESNDLPMTDGDGDTDVERERDYRVRISPQFRPFESGSASASQSSATGTGTGLHRPHLLHPPPSHTRERADRAREHEALTDEEGARTRSSSMDMDGSSGAGAAHAHSIAAHAAHAHAHAMEKAYYAQRAAAAAMASYAASSTPPLRPHGLNWTPTRGGDSYSRPPSASGAHHSAGSSGQGLIYAGGDAGSQHGSIPPSPALYGYDPFSTLRHDGAVRTRNRAMSLGFSMPMLDMDTGDAD